MGLFGWKKKQAEEAPSDPGSSGTGEVPVAADAKKGKEAHVPDPRKARRFFEHARTVADARNYDYAIECWINGLRHDPENMEAHEKLRDSALRRMVAGGKAAGMKDKMRHSGGKTPIDKMLNAEFLWSKDPLDPKLGLAVMENAQKANMEEVAWWVGNFVIEANDAQKKPDKTVYQKVKEIYSKMKVWDRAVEAMRRVAALEPNNMALLHELKQLEAEATVQKGGYAEKEGGFRKGIKDAEKQKALEEQDAIAGTEEQIDHNIERAKREYSEDSDSIDKLAKLIRALLSKNTEEAENQAISFLRQAHEKLGVYRLKMQIGDICMRQFNRKLRELTAHAKEVHTDAGRKKINEQFHQIRQEQLKFELGEFEERVHNYPTQMEFRYQLGLRQFRGGDIDLAIASFQEAQTDPKNRSQALRYLGEAFLRKHWFEESIDTFRRGLEQHAGGADDKVAMEMQYYLMMALEAKAKRDKSLPMAEEAARVASQIAQKDFNYKDIRHHIDNLRKLVANYRGEPGSSSG